MLKFMRNKIVGVEQGDDETLLAHGTLDDDIYAMRLDVVVRLADLEIISIRGWMDRYTTPECPAADGFLQEAVGLKINDPDFGRRVHKTIWRRSCQHYANLLVDCADCLVRAADLLGEKPPAPKQAAREPAPAPAESAPPAAPQAKAAPRTRRGQGFLVDMHLHTFPASPCASASADEMAAEAARIGLDAICLTDHNHVWDPEQAAALGRRHGILALRGNEITTDQGDIVVFGLDQDIQGVIKAEDLRREVAAAGGFMIAVHPFRGFLTFGVGRLGLTVEKARQRPLLKLVDAVEILNGRVTEKENAFTRETAAGLDLAITGGSDAHQVSEVGLYVTRFNRPIRDEADLIQALKEGGHQAAALRNAEGDDRP